MHRQSGNSGNAQAIQGIYWQSGNPRQCVYVGNQAIRQCGNGGIRKGNQGMLRLIRNSPQENTREFVIRRRKNLEKWESPSIIPGEGPGKMPGPGVVIASFSKILNFYQLAGARNPAKEKRCSPKASRTTLGNPL